VEVFEARRDWFEVAWVTTDLSVFGTRDSTNCSLIGPIWDCWTMLKDRELQCLDSDLSTETCGFYAFASE